MTDEQRQAEIEAGKRAGEEVRRETRQQLEDAGISLSYLIGKLQDELNAEETEFAKHQGSIMDERQVKAWDIRQRARQDAHKLRGDYPNETKNHVLTGADGTPLDITVSFVKADGSNTILNKNGPTEVDRDCGKDGKSE